MGISVSTPFGLCGGNSIGGIAMKDDFENAFEDSGNSPPPQFGSTGDIRRELNTDITPGELNAEYLDLNKQITVKVDAYVAQASKAKIDFDDIMPLVDRMQAMLSQRGRLRDLMDTAGLPTWTKWFEDFRERLHEEITIRQIQRKLREYRGIPDSRAKKGTKSHSTMSESVQPGSREDKTRPIWIDQAIKKVSYNAKHRRMEAEAECVEREKKVGKVGNPRKDRILGRITVWQAVYAEPKGKVDKAALRKAVLKKVQRADRKDKAVLEIRKEVKEEPFPGFTQFCWDIDQIAAVPLAWQKVLRNVKGVYLLVCNETGKQYVGSAKGEENLWGRFLDYAKTGHGGNVELKRRKSRRYQVTILEVVNSDTGIERIEEAWKRKLMTRQFGLNKN